MTEKASTDPRAIALDLLTGGLRMGAAERRLDDPQDAEQVYAAYLSLLYAVRGARPGEELALRSADLEALLGIVGEDPDQIESRLIELMGCTAEEASLLRRVLLRHRAVAASVGVAAGLSLVALVGPSVASAATSPGSTAPAPAPSASVAPLEQPPLTTYLTTDDGEHVPVPEGWDEAPEAADEALTPAAAPSAPAPVTAAVTTPVTTPVTTATATASTTSVAPSAASAAPATPSASPATPSAAPSPAAPVPSAPAPSSPVSVSEAETGAEAEAVAPESEVVLGEPRAPIDREGEVVLGEPRPPIDREGEVVLGEPRAPIDRPDPTTSTDAGTPTG